MTSSLKVKNLVVAGAVFVCASLVAACWDEHNQSPFEHKGKYLVLIDPDYDGPPLKELLTEFPEDGTETVAEDGTLVWFHVRHSSSELSGDYAYKYWHGGSRDPFDESSFMHGYLVTTHDGKWKSVSTYIHGESTGVHESYSDQDGSLESRRYRLLGQLHGTGTTYRKDGSKSAIQNWKYGLAHGLTTIHWDNGAVMTTGELSNDEKHGEWLMFHLDGVMPFTRKFYNHGRPIGIWKEYNRDGTLKSEENHGD